MPPRWFYPLAAACLVACTLAVVGWVWMDGTKGRYVFAPDGGGVFVLDTKTGTLCLSTTPCEARKPANAP
jgi:hypothetical protein